MAPLRAMMMALRRVLGLVVVAGALSAPGAQAAYHYTEHATGTFGVGAAAATDAAGATTVVLAGVPGGVQIVGRPTSGAAWAPAIDLPGRALGHPRGPVVAAAGQGAAAIAWRVDTPKRYAAIAAVVRDPGGTWPADAQVVSPTDANGVRHPALAIDADGGALLAYNTNTRVTHLSMRGAVAVSVRAAHGGSFAAPLVVDERPSSAPSAALAADGRGVVAWVRDRRVWAVSVDAARGTVGEAHAVTGRGSFGAVHVAAGVEGAATIAFLTRERDTSAVAVVRRPARGASFSGRERQIVERLRQRQYVQDLALAADQDGRTTLAWSLGTFGQDREIGVNGDTSAVHVASAAPDAARLDRPQTVFDDHRHECAPPALAVSSGDAVVAFRCQTRSKYVIYALGLTDAGPGALATVLGGRLPPSSYLQQATISAGLDAAGTQSLTIVDPRAASASEKPDLITEHVLTATGR